ncbi:hypothetical protein [Streptomyces sp. H27-H5]|nr:hypothetical protein [Streptomyces sp. H27-H5]MCY0957693.1 hypothetical protein [Streptomyces sp. H27-H5]
MIIYPYLNLAAGLVGLMAALCARTEHIRFLGGLIAALALVAALWDWGSW